MEKRFIRYPKPEYLQSNSSAKAAKLVKADGVIVYSTCSIEPEENFEIVKKFLEENPNFRFESAKENFPMK